MENWSISSLIDKTFKKAFRSEDAFLHTEGENANKIIIRRYVTICSTPSDCKHVGY